jgi:hypothetical protein
LFVRLSPAKVGTALVARKRYAAGYGAETNALKSLLDAAAPDELKWLSDYQNASAAANINVEQARRARDASDQQAGLLRSIELEAERPRSTLHNKVGPFNNDPFPGILGPGPCGQFPSADAAPIVRTDCQDLWPRFLWAN